MELSKTALEVLRARYLLRDEKGKIIESPEKMLRRVAKNVAKGSKKDEKEFFEIMNNQDFLPNSPTLMNAGTRMQQLSACFVIPVEDSMEGIFEALKNMAIIHQSGGGVGYSFSRLRPKGDVVKSTKGTASGPLSFMKIFDLATEIIKQGGKRRGANMGILHYSHPDILDFVSAKKTGILQNFNLSVSVDDKFINAVKKNKAVKLINPRTGKSAKKVKAKKIFDAIVDNAWSTGDPGLIFIDEINRKHPLREKIEATNPCGEQPLLPYESCNLGSINLSNMVRNGNLDLAKLKMTVRIAVKFLNNVIDVSRFPLKEIEKKTKKNRKIGLGVMGFAEMLIKLKIRYDSDEAVAYAEKVMSFIQKEAKKHSKDNKTITTIAPTGTISIIAGTSSGIEPLFGVKLKRTILGGKSFTEKNEMYRPALKKYFVIADEVPPEQHVRIQAAFQKYTDNAVSKTVNLPNNATKADVRKIFMLAHKLDCKGITVYRTGSRKEQVITCLECQ